MVRAFLGLGSNLGDKEAYLREAVASFSDLRSVSGLYETDPVGGVEQDTYLNIVIELSTERSCRDLLEHGQRLEKNANRVREIRWGPRTLDVDILFYEGCQISSELLTIPHPRIEERRFGVKTGY